tara:strand:- start:3061 stop:3258 length:198 start_codon:yes stop_codon:yes gene_type:complete
VSGPLQKETLQAEDKGCRRERGKKIKRRKNKIIFANIFDNHRSNGIVKYNGITKFNIIRIGKWNW